MNPEFSRIITEERKKRNLSQKQAAADLGISQALLSHYEKGIRECGLDFVVRIADYYNVSCDYLLRRSDIEKSEPKDMEQSIATENICKIFNKFMNNNSHIVSEEIYTYMLMNFYKLIRITDNRRNNAYSIPDNLAENLTDSVITKLCASIKIKHCKNAGENISEITNDDTIRQMIRSCEQIIHTSNTL